MVGKANLSRRLTRLEMSSTTRLRQTWPFTVNVERAFTRYNIFLSDLYSEPRLCIILNHTVAFEILRITILIKAASYCSLSLSKASLLHIPFQNYNFSSSAINQCEHISLGAPCTGTPPSNTRRPRHRDPSFRTLAGLLPLILRQD